MMRRFRLRKKINVSKVVTKLLVSVIGLWVGGTVMHVLSDVMMCTHSPFYKGLSLVGWTITNSVVINATGGTFEKCNTTSPLNGITQGTYNNVVTASTGTGVLAVIGIVALASIVTEFVEFRL